MPLGNPIRKQNESRIISVLATEGQSVFTVEGGYIINQISVFRNGVRLSNSEDFTAGDGSTVTLNNEANIDDRIEFHVFDRFTVNNAIVGAASSQTISGDVVINGKIFGNLDVPSINTGIVTATELDLNGKGDISGDLNVTGVTTVGKQIHVGTGVSIAAGGINVTAGVSTFAGSISVTGISTLNGNIFLNQSDPKIFFNDGGSMISNANVANTLAFFSDGSTERARITSGGEFLIGTTTDANIKLDVEGSVRAKAAAYVAPASGTGLELYYATGTLSDTPSSYLLSYDRDSSAYKKLNIDASEHKIRTSGTERLRIDTSGRVLIGTTTEGAADADNLTIADSGSCGITIRSGTSAAGGLYFSDATSGAAESDGAILYNHSSKFMAFYANESERMRITSDGKIGIGGESSPEYKVTVYDAEYSGVTIKTNRNNSTSNIGGLHFKSRTTNVAYIQSLVDGTIKFRNSSSLTEKLRIDTGGRVIVGHTAALTVAGHQGHLQLNGDDYNQATFQIVSNEANSNGSYIHLSKQRSGSAGGTTIVQNGDSIGKIRFTAADGTNLDSRTAEIEVYIDGTPGVNDTPGRMILSTTADGAQSTTERMRIDSKGRIGIQGAATKGVLDVRASGGAADQLTAVFGANEGQAGGSLSDNADKGGRVGLYHYDLDEEPFGLFTYGSSSSANTLNFGGGTSLMNASTSIGFYTAANTTTTNGTKRMTIDSSGKLLIGSNTHNSTIASGVGSQLQIEGTSYLTSGISLINNQNSTDPAFLVLGKSRAGSNGGTTIVQNSDRLGAIRFAGADGTDLHSYGAEIACIVNGTPGGNDMPGQLIFATTPDGSASPTTRLQIQADGKIFAGNDTTNQDANVFVIVGDKNVPSGIVQGQLAVADNSAYNVSDNGGGIGFQAKFNSGGAYTQMASIQGNKASNGDGNYEGYFSVRVRHHNSTSNEKLRIRVSDSIFRTSISTEQELNMVRDDGTPQSKYMDIGFLNNSFFIRRTNGGDGGHAVVMSITSSGTISGTLNNTSDEKLKENIASVSDGSLALVKQLRPVTFDWKDSTFENNQTGFIAQEVKTVIPNLISGEEYDETKVNEKGQIISTGYSISNVGLVAHLTKALQELSAKNDALEARIAALEGS